MQKLFQIAEPTKYQEPEQSDLLNTAVGIDLGTTNSLIAIWDKEENKAKLIPMNDDNLLSESDSMGNSAAILPSVVNYSNINNKKSILIGEKASRLANSFRSVKRLMGKGIEDIINEKQFSHFNIDLDKSSSRILFLKDQDNNSYSIPEIASQILLYLKHRAENYLGNFIDYAVITVPAHFDEAARIATRDAAKIAGIKVLRLLNEPTSAAIAYGLDKQPKGNYLIYDLGGGTFDVSILKMQQGVLKVIATGGDSNLGGDDFDISLAQLISDKISINNIDQEVILLAKTIKESLSFIQNWYGKYKTHEFNISIEEAEQCWQPLIDRTRKILHQTLSDSNFSIKEIDEIILVGGATRIPSIKKMLINFLGKAPLSDVNPDEVVAVGAAIQASALTVGSDHLLLDVNPLSLGIELMGRIVEPIIPRNSLIPIEVKKIYTTYKDNQTAFKIHVLQGESNKVEQCRSLAIFELKGIQPKAAGLVKLELTFRIDADGLLTVTAYESSSGKSQNIEVKPSYGLTEDELIKLINATHG